MADAERQNPEVMLKLARGGLCVRVCGRPLVPAMWERRQVAVTHETHEDEDHHLAFWGGTRGSLAEDETETETALGLDRG